MAKRSARRRRVDAFLQSSRSPILFVDAKRRITFFNAGCEAFTGWQAEDVLGRVCHYETQGEPGTIDSLTGPLCPPPQTYEGDTVRQPMLLMHRDGRPLTIHIDFHPIRDADGDVSLVLGFLSERDATGDVVPASASQKLHAELAALRAKLQQKYNLQSLVACSRPMQRVAGQIAAAARSNASVLFTGEPGTGKQHLARIVHTATRRRSGRRSAESREEDAVVPAGLEPASSFVPIDCRNLPAREIRRTLQRLFEPDEETGFAGTEPGTIYLQDAELLPRDLQESLVQWVQSRPDSAPLLRLTAGSAADFEGAFRDEQLRDDYFYLATTMAVSLPPLRERVDDLQPLAQAFLEEMNRSDDRQVGGFSEAVWEQFRRYQWPGNLDELRAVVAEARTSCDEPLVDVSHLPFRFRTGLEAQREGPPVQSAVRPLEELLAETEAGLIREALEQARDNKALAAKLLGISRPRLYRRMEELGVSSRE